MKKVINDFLNEQHIAIVGVSRSPNKWGNDLLKELRKLGKTIYPVHPHATELEGPTCYTDLKSLPENVTSLIIAVKPESTDQIVQECLSSPIKRVWMQKGVMKGSHTESAISFCKENGIDYVYGFCPMMFFGKGVHSFHLWLRKTFGKVPQEFTR